MLVRFSTGCAQRRSRPALLLLGLASCSLVVGQLPEPAPGGPAAGDASVGPDGGEAAAQGGSAVIQQGGNPASGGKGSGVAGSANGGSSGSNCDADHDQHLAPGKCGGDDCDDQDADVSPEQSGYFAERQAHVDYDYDCSGTAEQEQMAAIVCSGVAVGPCPTETGFLKTLPACGEVGVWGTCVKTPPLNTCDQKVVDNGRRMRCH